MLSDKPYATPVTDVFMLCPKDRMMFDNEPSGSMPGPIVPAPVRLPEDN